MVFDRHNHTDAQLLELYRQILLPRMIEERMLLLLRQGKISKWFSGIGQEAIAVGSTLALQKLDYILPLHRNLGVFTSRNIPLGKLFAQWQGKATGFTKGRDRSFHFGTPDYRIIGMISHLGAMLGVADGLALGGVLDGDNSLALVFSGDGGASQGDFHEAINVAAVWELPVIFLVENNGYALSTPSREQYRFERFIDKAIGYGVDSERVDGNDILAVHDTIKRVAHRVRATRKPVLIEAMTFRMRGHEEASGTAYVPKELLAEWEERDPVVNYERYLLGIGLLKQSSIDIIRAALRENIDTAVTIMFDADDPVADDIQELGDVFAPSPILGATDQPKEGPEKRFIDAISEGLRQGMQRDESIVLMGQDVAEYGGVFKITQGFVEEFGRDRVRNTPLCESAIVGASLGLSIRNYPSVVEMQFADFVSNGFNQIVNNLAKTHYRWDQPVNVTVRMPTGAGVAAGPFHSQSTEAWFAHTPGIKVVYPATPYDAKGLLATALTDPNPVMYFEHKALYRSIRGPVPDEYYTIPFGKARYASMGSDLTIITYGAGVHWALTHAKQLPEISIEIIDLRTLIPWDRDTVFSSVRKTGKCLVFHEDTRTGGFGAEIAATVSEELFGALDAPVMRLGSLDTPVPFNKNLEENFLAQSKLQQTIEKLLRY